MVPGNTWGAHPVGRSSERHMRSLRILIVEDEFFIALDVEEQAKALGHIVVGTAITADEAIAMAEKEKPDVVLMDIRLIGEKDGIAAAREIQSQFGIQSIFVTANTDPSTLKQARNAFALRIGAAVKVLVPFWQNRW